MRSPEMLPPIKNPIPNQDSKSLSMSPPIIHRIKNQDSNRNINKQDPIIPPLLEKYPTEY